MGAAIAEDAGKTQRIVRRDAMEATPARETEEDVAGYLFDLLVGARRLAVTRRQKFLAYLIGVAAEEARLLTQGRSAIRGAAAANSAKPT
jgi:hypothetical protein